MLNPDKIQRYVVGDTVFWTSYARTALVAALKAVPVENREVLLPGFTCPVAVVGAVREAGGRPVFVKVNLQTLGLDLDDFEARITSDSASVLTHHYFGTIVPDTDKVHDIAETKGLIHIQDCSHSMGARAGSECVGSPCHAAVYSFSKTMLCPGGGLLACRHESAYTQRVKKVVELKERNLIGDLLLNMEALSFLYQLFIIRRFFEKPSQPIKSMFLLHRLPRLWYIMAKVLNRGTGGRYYHGSFYGAASSTFPDFDVKMTALQYFLIDVVLRDLDRQIQKRRRIARRLKAIFPNYIAEPDQHFFVYPTYVLCTSNKKKLMTSAEKSNIWLAPTWLSEKGGAALRVGSRMDFLRDHMLLMNLSAFWTEKDIHIAEQFFYENKALLIRPSFGNRD